MPSLKDLRNRIAATKATQKITKAMQMVAAAKLRRAQSAAVAARPYAERMDAVLSNIASWPPEPATTTVPARPRGRHQRRPRRRFRGGAAELRTEGPARRRGVQGD